MRNRASYCFQNYILIILIIGSFTASYGQKEITKNGIKINKLDKKNKKQGSWFFFDALGNLEVSCFYENDSITKPIVFYKKQDSAFIRYPKINNSELFLLKSNNKWVVGSFETIKKDSIKIEVLGFYKKIGKSSLDIEENIDLSNSVEVQEEAIYWMNKEIQPLYMFGTETLNDFYLRVMHSSKFMFNKNIYVDLTVSAAGQIEKISFTRDKNKLTSDEENELIYLFTTMMQRWQPFFSKNKTESHHKFLELGTSLKY